MDKTPALIKKLHELKKNFEEDDTTTDSEIDTDIDSPEGSDSNESSETEKDNIIK